jgi:diguanylate cyclase (GGDEF)-like protein/PAS domain S-box-containing protein
MTLTVPLRQSIKTRITFATLAILLVSLWSLSYYASRMLRQDMARVLGENQFTTVSILAQEVDEELGIRLRALEKMAPLMAPTLQSDVHAVQTFLDGQQILQDLFNGGLIAYRLDGTAIAETPHSAGRIGVNYMEVDTIAAALQQGRTTIGRPLLGKKLQAPVFGMTAPIRDAQGRVIGALAGVINLGLPNFLDKVAQGRYGRTGGYVLAAPQHGLNVTASNPSRILATLPAPGVNPVMDRYAQGHEGTDVFINPLGVEVLASVKRVPVAGWYMAVTLPVEEAFAPIRAMQQRMLQATLLLTLLAGFIVWWMTKRQLAPLLGTARQLARMGGEHQSLQILPIKQHDEIGQLIGGFNRLLATLGQREGLLKQILDTSSVAIFLVDRSGCITLANQRMADMFGLPLAALTGLDYASLVDPQERDTARRNMHALLTSTVQTVDVERRYWRADHSEFWGRLTGQRFIDAEGIEQGLVGVIADITQRRRAEAELHIAATAFESQQGIFVTDAARTILRVNQSFTEITGFTAADAVGQSPRFLGSGRQGGEFYGAMWDRIEATGSWQGELWNRRKNGEVFPEWLTITAVKNEQAQVTHYVATFADITARKVAEDAIKNLAFYDPLTQLPNRRLLMDRLEQALASSARHQLKGALLFVDLDNFKTINDTLGHDKGDLLLQQVAQRLQRCVRDGDTVARLGGDEFVLMLEGLSESALDAATQAESVGEQILISLNQTYQFINYDYHSTPSIGITLFGEHPETLDEPLKRADLAMYQAKAAGRNTLRFFDPQMQAVVSSRAALEAGLREALVKEQFSLYYQAQVNHTGQPTGAEALVRWLHPERGMVSPAEFIPLAEDTGLILPLGRWVLETACRQLACWASQPGLAHLTLAVNVSARQFHHSGFVEQVLTVLAHTGAKPQRLKLELTESLLVSNVEDVIAKMNTLKAHGVGFSLDDFGTGYSSLSYLKRLPLDQLKIDQGFVRDILADGNDAAIANMVIVLAATLGLSVIAEGVETEAQRSFLASQGCHAYQGYLFSRPLPLPGFEAFVDSNKLN